MTDIPENTNATDDEALAIRQNRIRIARFVGIFVVTVLVLLTSYRYAIHTTLNDWYLFQAARHTTCALGAIGHAELEPSHYGRQNAQQVRASIKAWAEGRDAPTEEEIAAAPRHSLTPWERWSFRAREMRRKDVPGINGPRVYFVLRPGLVTEIDELMGRINRIEDTIELDEAERNAQLEPLRREMSALRQKQQELRAPSNTQEVRAPLIFQFILIPECGAIEIMAIFLAAVLAFPTLWWKRIVGLAAGLPVMYLVNIFRLTVLAVIGAMDTSRVYFNFAHEYVWQAIYIIFVVVVWLIWVEYVVKGRRS